MNDVVYLAPPPKLEKREPRGPVFHDLTGQRFGNWTVVRHAGFNPKGVSYWRCRCECGSMRNVPLGNLRAGMSQSCGDCYVGKTKHPLYTRWSSAKRFMCPEWLESFEAFCAGVGEHRKGYLYRKDRAKPLGPGNFQWCDKKPSGRAAGWGIKITHNGMRLTLTEWAKRLGLSRQGIHYRMKKMTPQQAVSYVGQEDSPIRHNRRGNMKTFEAREEKNR